MKGNAGSHRVCPKHTRAFDNILTSYLLPSTEELNILYTYLSQLIIEGEGEMSKLIIKIKL